MADKRLAVRIDLEFEAGKVAEQSLANAIDKMKKKAGKLDLDLQFDNYKTKLLQTSLEELEKNLTPSSLKKLKRDLRVGI